VEEDPEVEEGIAALWEEVLLAPLNSESVTHWPWLFDDLEAEEVEVILQLEAEVVEAHQEAEEEAQQQIPHRYPLPQWPTSRPWEHPPVTSTETDNKQETL
jgi:hypothetical protein